MAVARQVLLGMAAIGWLPLGGFRLMGRGLPLHSFCLMGIG